MEWNEATAAMVKLGLASLGLLSFAFVEWARPAPSTDANQPSRCPRLVRWSEIWLRGLGGLALLAYVNFGAFHFHGIFVHLWDMTHHYLGAKYFDELGYDGLYECLAVADLEAQAKSDRRAGPAPRIADREMVDLRTDRVGVTAEILSHPDRCLRRFTDRARWRAFASDVAFFRAAFPEVEWERLSGDHGFNASPLWVSVAHPLAGNGPVTWTRLRALAAIDIALMCVAFGLVSWAFGLRAAALAAIVFGTYFPARLWWTGGSFLRWDWLAFVLSGLALCRKGRNRAGGACLGYAALVRVFPIFALVGAALAFGMAKLRRRPCDRGVIDVLLGAALSAAVLLPASALLQRPGAWSAFAANLDKHAAVASPNRMGLPMVLAYSPDQSGVALAGKGVPAGAAIRLRWQQAQAETLGRRRGWWAALAALFAGGVAFAVSEEPAWASCALGLSLSALGASLACYYYAFVVALVLLSDRRREVGGMALALSVASLAVARLTRYGTDQQYVAQSLLVLVASGFIVSAFLGRDPISGGPRSAAAPMGARLTRPRRRPRRRRPNPAPGSEAEPVQERSHSLRVAGTLGRARQRSLGTDPQRRRDAVHTSTTPDRPEAVVASEVYRANAPSAEPACSAPPAATCAADRREWRSAVAL